MLMRTKICALMLLGSGCTTAPPLTPAPSLPLSLAAPCERPMPVIGTPTAGPVLLTVTRNYARHHRCADTLDALQGWVRDQSQVK